MNLSSRCKAALAVAGGLAAAVAAVNGAETAYGVIEPWWYATRGYVRDYAHVTVNPTVAGITEIQLTLAKNRRAQIKDRLLSEQIVLSKTTDPEDRIRKQAQIDNLEEEYRDVEATIGALMRPRGGPR